MLCVDVEAAPECPKPRSTQLVLPAGLWMIASIQRQLHEGSYIDWLIAWWVEDLYRNFRPHDDIILLCEPQRQPTGLPSPAMATTDWALRQIQGLLPLDEESLLQVLDYTSSLTNDAAAEHLKTLLGDSPRALEFISSYNARRNPAPAPAPAPTRSSVSALGVGPFEQDAGVPKSTTKQPKRRAPLHQLPSRKIEGQGDTSGGYQKSFGRDQNAAFLAQRGASTESTPDTTRLSDTPVARQLPKKTAGKLPPSAAGSLISDLPNVKQRTQNQSHNSARNASPAPKTKVTIQGGVAGKGASSTLEDLVRPPVNLYIAYSAFPCSSTP